MVRWAQLVICVVAGFVAGSAGLHFEEQLNNPLGFLVLLVGPLAFGVAISAPRIADRAAMNGFATAAAAAITLGSGIAGADEDGGGPFVLAASTAARLLVMSLPLLVFKLGALVHGALR